MGLRLLLILILVGCNDYNSEREPIPLSLYMDLPVENGYYVYDYPNELMNSYTSVRYNTDEITRVFWTSSDSFTIEHQGYPIKQPIINYSTYSDNNGNGKQLVYLYQNHIGDTLDIIGCVDETCKMIEFIVE